MNNIDRKSPTDAKNCINDLLCNENSANKLAILNFLAEKILFANKQKAKNWNLNLDLKGSFLRFNVGQEYCIEINKSGCLILCIRDSLPKEIHKFPTIEWCGHTKREKIQSTDINTVPDCLAKIKGSIGCLIKDNFIEILPMLQASNLQFIEEAANKTIILPQMKTSHSIGAISFISELTDKSLINPEFSLNLIQEQELRLTKEINNFTLPEITEKQILQKARIGQSIFRQLLIDYWKQCALTGCIITSILKASHIKPWSECTSAERLDKFNGLLLSPNADSLFDAGLISFTNQGELIISSEINHHQIRDVLGGFTKLSKISKHHAPYLEYHRTIIFKKSAVVLLN